MTIDGKEILSEYGCVLSEESYSDLFRYPKRTAVNYNDWAESDGIEPDLTEIDFEPRKISLSFTQKAATPGDFMTVYNKLYSRLTADGYRNMVIVPGITHRLRLNDNPTYSRPVAFQTGVNLTTFSLGFIEDVLEIPPATAASSLRIPGGAYRINGIDFSQFGVGTDEDRGDDLTYPALKDPFSDGRTIYLNDLKRRHKTVKLRLWMVASGVNEFIRNWRAFFSQFNKTGLQALYFNSAGCTQQVYYSECTSFTIEYWGAEYVGARMGLSLVIPHVSI